MQMNNSSLTAEQAADSTGKWEIPPGVSPDYSVVVPFFNEADAAPVLLAEILSVMHTLPGIPECICIDDGSSDSTASILQQWAEKHGSIFRVIRLPVNRGQAAALLHGLLAARGDAVVTMDGDCQNDPADIPLLLRELEHADLVCGIRAQRHDNTLRRVMSRIANMVRGRLLGDGMRDSGCALKAMRREVIRSLVPIRTLYSFIPAMAVAAGFRVREVPVNHRARSGGTSNYGFLKFAIMPLVDMLGLLWYRKRCILRQQDCLGAIQPTGGKSR